MRFVPSSVGGSEAVGARESENDLIRLFRDERSSTFRGATHVRRCAALMTGGPSGGLRPRPADRSALPCIAGALRRSLLVVRCVLVRLRVRLRRPAFGPGAPGSICRRRHPGSHQPPGLCDGARRVLVPIDARIQLWPGVWGRPPRGVKRMDSLRVDPAGSSAGSSPVTGGAGEIRTHEGLHPGGFQDLGPRALPAGDPEGFRGARNRQRPAADGTGGYLTLVPSAALVAGLPTDRGQMLRGSPGRPHPTADRHVGRRRAPCRPRRSRAGSA